MREAESMAEQPGTPISLPHAEAIDALHYSGALRRPGGQLTYRGAQGSTHTTKYRPSESGR